MQTTTYLITGAAGFIGRHLVRRALETTDARLILIDGLNYAADVMRLHSMLLYKPEWQRRVKVLYHDLRAPFTESLREQIGPVDAVFNLASDSHVDRSIADPVPFVRNNVELMLNVLEFCRVAKPRILMQCSTDEVYGVPMDGPHKEWERHMPSNPYAASKAAQEDLCVAWWRTYGVPVVITNTMNNFGEGQNEEKFVPKTVRALFSKKCMLAHAQRNGVGEWVFSSRVWIHASDHADALLWLAAKHLKEGVPAYPAAPMPEKYNVAGDHEVGVDEMIRWIAEAVGLNPGSGWVTPTDFHSTRPGHDMRYALDSSKLRKAGWVPRRDLRESLAETARWFYDEFAFHAAVAKDTGP